MITLTERRLSTWCGETEDALNFLHFAAVLGTRGAKP